MIFICYCRLQSPAFKDYVNNNEVYQYSYNVECSVEEMPTHAKIERTQF